MENIEHRIIGLDIGTKRTGIAVSDETKIFSLPLTVIEASDMRSWICRISEICHEYPVSCVVVGFPLNQHGEEGNDAKRINQYIVLLQEQIKVPVIKWDERFTTAQAERLLITADVSRKRRKQHIDKIAASIILQSYLDSLRFCHQLKTDSP